MEHHYLSDADTAGVGNIALFLEAAADALGSAHVVVERVKVRELSSDPVYTAVPPVAFVYPASTAEVIAIVAAANKYSVTLWPYSTGKNWGYCNTTGNHNSVVVILNRMNKIRCVDYELAYAEIEPGVTYEQLNAYMKDNGIDLWTDCTGGPPSGSVLGNALDRGVGTTPSGDHFANLCGLEVVLPNGNVIRTGGFPDEEDGAWHTYKWGVGPGLEGLFAQSNLGIVTRAGIWLMRKPEDFTVGSVRIDDENQLAPALDEFRELMLRGVLPEKARFSNDVAMFTLVTQARDERLEGQQLTKGARAALRKKFSIPKWTGSFGIYGTPAHVKTMRREARRQLRSLGRTLFLGDSRVRFLSTILQLVAKYRGFAGKLLEKMLNYSTGSTLPVLRLLPALIDVHKGIPNETVVRRAYFRSQAPRPESGIDVARDNIGVFWFVPLLPLRGREIEHYLAQCEPEFERFGFDFYVTIMLLNARTAVPLMMILYDPDDGNSCESAKMLYDKLYRDALQRGYQQFRCALPGWEEMFADLPELRETYETLKDALDPGHIIAPGRYGIA